MSVIEFYEKQERVRRIDANKGLDEVYEDIVQVLRGYIDENIDR